jgi:glycosyltransferase involved in cell wall biosynthesis
MRILWDFRLFSLGYGRRGIGAWTARVAAAYRASNPAGDVAIWGDRAACPPQAGDWAAEWVPYRLAGWKRDLIAIPALLRRHNIDIMHYWVALGPLWQIGLGLWRPCRTVATVYDLGAEYWADVPNCASVNRTWYWRAQKRLARAIDRFICISETTRADLQRLMPNANARVIRTPPPPPLPPAPGGRRTYLLTLGGAPNKNLRSAVAAFSRLRADFPEYTLVVCGDIDKQWELPGAVPPGVTFESMEHYRLHLCRAAALVFCSTHEGLGLPPIEAMAAGCPVVTADIPALHETCGTAARFADPHDPNAVAAAIAEVIRNREDWAARARRGWERWNKMGRNTGDDLARIYQELRPA